MIKRVNVAALCAAALVCGLVLSLPGMAHAAGSITVISAGSPAAHAGELSVTIESSSAVVPGSITAELQAPGDSSPALTLTDFTLTSGTNSGSGGTTTWTVSSPITQAELPLGSYAISVQAANSGGQTANVSDIGTLNFIIYPTLTLSISPMTVSYGQTVTLSGTETGLYPDGTIAPLAGQEIFYLPGSTAVTDADGNYSISLEGGIGNGLYLYDPTSVQVEATDTAAAAVSNEVTEAVTTDPMRFTGLSLSPATVSYPAGVSVSGTVSYESDGTWLPWADSTVSASAVRELELCDGCAELGPWPDQSGADGSFTIAIPGPMAPDSYSIRQGESDLDDTPWFSVPSVTVKVPVHHVPLRVTSMTAALNTKGDVALSVCGDPRLVLGDPGDMSPFPRGTFEYATSRSGPWKWVRGASSVTAVYGPPTHYNGCYRAKVKAPGQSVYYRLVTPAGTAYQSMTSSAFRATKPAGSDITRLRVTPTSIRAGSQVKVTGVLNFKPSQPERDGLKIRILFRRSGSRKWTVAKTVATYPAASGFSKDFAAKISLHASGSVAASFYGTLLIFPSKSASVFVRVHG